MSGIDSLTKQFKDFAELKAYSDSQYKLIIDLSKKISDLEAEKAHLKKLLESNSGNLILPDKKELENIPDEESIARMQLALLRNEAINRELTLEETKKFEIYTKILLSIKGKPTKDDGPKKPLSTEDLLKLADSIGLGNSE